MDWTQEPWLCQIAEKGNDLPFIECKSYKTKDVYFFVSFQQLQRLFNRYFITSVYVQALDNDSHTAKCWKILNLTTDVPSYLLK